MKVNQYVHANQFELRGEGKHCLQSYDSLVVELSNGKIILGRDWDYSTTTSKHVYMFLEDYTDVKLPNKYINWQYRCCIELYKGAGQEGIVSYAENGLNWSKLSDGLPISLTNEIIPEVGVPRPKGSE